MRIAPEESRWSIDPVKIKFLQLIGAEIFGAILSLVGLYMFFRGITGTPLSTSD